MTDREKPEEVADSSLDEAQGGLIVNLSVGVKADAGQQDPIRRAERSGVLETESSDFATGTTGDPNV